MNWLRRRRLPKPTPWQLHCHSCTWSLSITLTGWPWADQLHLVRAVARHHGQQCAGLVEGRLPL